MSMSGKSPGPDALAQHLRRRIEAGGALGFDDFMAAALYDPHFGYYAADAARTGKHGDFLTSVSIGPVFGRLLAAQFAEIWDKLGRPEDFTLVEQGANDGQLMTDILATIDRSHAGFEPRVIIVEPLPNLRARQRATLARWSRRVTLVAGESDLPQFTGVFFANELLDAFPVKLLVRSEGAWHERRVGHDGDKFVLVETPVADPAMLAAAQALPVAGDIPRFATEICPSLGSWMNNVAEKLLRGCMLLIDYGHPAAARHHAARSTGTLAAYRGHERAGNPLDSPGSLDLTAHVDFTAVARAGERAGLRLAGFTDQHHALTALAALVFPPMPETIPAGDAAREMRALRQLLHPESMGTSFKFLALSRGIDTVVSCFRFARDAHRELFQ